MYLLCYRFARGARYTCHWRYMHKISLRGCIINGERELGECFCCRINYPQALWLKRNSVSWLSFAGQLARVAVICKPNWVGCPRYFTDMAELFWLLLRVLRGLSTRPPACSLSRYFSKHGNWVLRGDVLTASVSRVPGGNCKASCNSFGSPRISLPLHSIAWASH